MAFVLETRNVNAPFSSWRGKRRVRIKPEGQTSKAGECVFEFSLWSHIHSAVKVANLKGFCEVIFLLRGWKTAKFTPRLWIYKQKLCWTKSCPTAMESAVPFGNRVPEGWTLHSVASKWPWRRHSIEFNLHCHITLTEVLNHFISLLLKLLCGINRIGITAEIRLLRRETKHCWVNELWSRCLLFDLL